ncbi:MAG: hypothetical protein ROO73_03270 [Roseivirga sp.]
MAALTELKALDKPIASKDILMVSLGTGKVQLSKPALHVKNAGMMGWVVQANLIDIMMSADSEWAETVIEQLYPHNYRLQVPITPALSHMDDSSPENLAGLLKAAEDYLQQQEEVVAAVCNELTR